MLSVTKQTMTFIDYPKTTNVKISFRWNVSDCIEDLIPIAHKVTNSYLILKRSYTISIYHKIVNKANLINITGIPNFSLIDEAFQQFISLHTTLAREPPTNFRISIDNTTSNGQFPHKIDFSLLHKSECTVRHSPLFPGAFLKLPNNITTILFKSGKYVLLGCHSEEHINISFSYLCQVLNKIRGLIE
jgi:TATA-box binding protein (TBP) (component of TFIID and TFIIIB)